MAFPTILRITVSSGNTVKIPHLSGAYTYDYLINYGDGSPVVHVTSFDDTGCTHTFVYAGTYDIEISGTCETISVNDTGTLKQYLTNILSWGSVGLKLIEFSGCHSLESIPADTYGGLALITDFSGTFYGCDKLISIPAALFSYCTGVTTFSRTFLNCSALITLFKN